ncbi:MAG: hypothetical protein K1Y36_22835 [Blastocatellia bacterium]|nr:hypothetical protein [Blastocatellia bacterium]
MPRRPYRWLWISLVVGFFLAVGNFIGHVPSYVSAAGSVNPKSGQTPQAQSGAPDTVEEFENESIEAEGDDPDLPSFFKGKINKKDYLRRRGEYFAKLRGLPHSLPYEPRSKAIQLMERQELEGRRLGLVPKINSSTWTSLGPNPIPNGQTSPSVAVSGRTPCVAIHPTNPNIVYAGTAGGGLYRTTDGGTTWTALMDSAQSLAIGAVAIAPSQPSTIYVGTGEASSSLDGYFGVGLYRIDNADTTPTLTGPINPLVTTGIANTTAFTGRSISKIVVHPTDPATIFVGTSTGIGGIGGTTLSGSVPPLALRGVYRSTNATSASPAFTKLTVTTAGSVAPDTTGGRSVTDIVMDPSNPNVLVVGVVGNAAAGDGGCYQSTNALGATPTFTQTRTTVTSGARVELAINRVGSTTTVLAATGDNSTGQLFLSTDAGATWPTTLTNANGYCGGQCFYDIAVALDPGNANNIYIGGAASGASTRIFARSTNGTTFTASSSGLHADTHAIAVAPSNPSIVYTGNDGGIFKSTDAGVSWTSVNNSSYNATQFQSLALHPTDRTFMIGGTQDNGTQRLFTSSTTGASFWKRSDGGDGGFTLIDQNTTSTTSLTMYHTYFNQSPSQIGFARITSVSNSTASVGTDSWLTFLARLWPFLIFEKMNQAE